MSEAKIQIRLPKVEQSSDYDCGPAALRAICRYFNVGPDDHKQFVRDCQTTAKDGTEPEHLVRVARKYGLQAVAKHGMTIDELQKCLDEKKAVICDIQAWGSEKHYRNLNSGHYVVAIGYDKDTIYFEDPSLYNGRRGSIKKDDLPDRWKGKKANGEVLTRYGIIIWKNSPPQETDHREKASSIE